MAWTMDWIMDLILYSFSYGGVVDRQNRTLLPSQEHSSAGSFLVT